MTDHALASPSSAAMWMACPASITLAGGRVRPSSKYAKEGTAAHKIAEMILGGNLFPPPKITVEGDEFIVGRDMLQHLNPYISLVEQYQNLGFAIYTEQRVHLRMSGGLVWGTADCLASGLGRLAVIDLKFGKGVLVDPDSAQLKIYALAALETFKSPAKEIILTVVQPRLDPAPKAFSMHVADLKQWQTTYLVPALEKIVNGSTNEVAGPHCRWCVRRDECQAYASQKSNAAASIFDDGVLDSVENVP